MTQSRELSTLLGLNKDKMFGESKTLTLNTGFSDDNEVVDNKRMDVLENSIFVDGTELYESKEIETLLNGKSTRQSILKHTRRIGNQQYILLEKKNKGQILSTETITTMTPNEVMEFKEKWRIMWHPEISEDKILDLVNTKVEPETNTEVEAAEPATQETPVEESRKKQEPEWCVWCVLLGCAVCTLSFLNVEAVLILVLLLKNWHKSIYR